MENKINIQLGDIVLISKSSCNPQYAIVIGEANEYDEYLIVYYDPRSFGANNIRKRCSNIHQVYRCKNNYSVYERANNNDIKFSGNNSFIYYCTHGYRRPIMPIICLMILLIITGSFIGYLIGMLASKNWDIITGLLAMAIGGSIGGIFGVACIVNHFTS